MKSVVHDWLIAKRFLIKEIVGGDWWSCDESEYWLAVHWM
jgi:hypothetical protein